MRSVNTILVVIASISAFAAAEASTQDSFESNLIARDPEPEAYPEASNEESFAILARDLEIFERTLPRPGAPSYPPGHFSSLPPSKPHDVPHRGVFDPTPPQKPSEHGDSYFPKPGASSSRIAPARNRAGSFKRTLPRPGAPSYPPGHFSSLPPSKPHDVPHRGVFDPTPPQKPSEHGDSYFPKPGASSSRIAPARNRAGSFKRDGLDSIFERRTKGISRPNAPSFPKGSFDSIPKHSTPHDVSHHNWDSPVPNKPSEQGSSYFPAQGSAHPAAPATRPNRAQSFKRDGFEKRTKGISRPNAPSFPAGSFANLPKSQPHDVPHHNWNSPIPQKPSEGGNSYFPTPGTTTPAAPARNRAGSFKRSELDEEA